MKLETTFNVIPSDNYLIIEAWNKHCKIRVAEKNNKVIYRLIKTSLKLYLKTLKTLYYPLSFGSRRSRFRERGLG